MVRIDQLTWDAFFSEKQLQDLVEEAKYVDLQPGELEPMFRNALLIHDYVSGVLPGVFLYDRDFILKQMRQHWFPVESATITTAEMKEIKEAYEAVRESFNTLMGLYNNEGR